MIFHENRLLTDDSHEISYHIYFENWGKMSQNLSSVAVVIGAFRVKKLSSRNLSVSLASGDGEENKSSTTVVCPADRSHSIVSLFPGCHQLQSSVLRYSLYLYSCTTDASLGSSLIIFFFIFSVSWSKLHCQYLQKLITDYRSL